LKVKKDEKLAALDKIIEFLR